MSSLRPGGFVACNFSIQQVSLCARVLNLSPPLDRLKDGVNDHYFQFVDVTVGREKMFCNGVVCVFCPNINIRLCSANPSLSLLLVRSM